MKKNYHISNKKDPIYFIVPGFMGNYQEGFIGNIYNYLLKNNYSFYGVEFKGHRENEKILANPNEMITHLKSEYLKIKNKYPLRQINILAHSQGCAITLKLHNCFKKKTHLTLMAPAIFIDKIILPRIDIKDMRLIKLGTPTNTKVSKDKFKILDKKWIEAYEKFSLLKSLPKIKQNCLIIRPLDDFIDKKNALILKEKIPQNSYLEIIGNHWFDEPTESFTELVKKIF
jgi:esterase/lipase